MSKAVSLRKITNFMEAWAPLENQAKWDNCGLQIGDKSALISSVIVAMDVDLPLLTHLEKEPVDLVITHHPLFFKGIKSLRYDTDMGRILSSFITKNRHLYSAHTNLDVAEGGVNDCLISAYDFKPADGKELSEGFGKYFKLKDAISISDLQKKHGGTLLGDLNQKTTNKVAFCCGSGKSFLASLPDRGITCMVTGEIGYHDEIFCELNGITVLSLGHRESENFVLPGIQSRLQKQFKILDVRLFLRK